MNIPEAINQGKLALGQENRPILIAEPVLRLGIEALELIKNVREQKTGYLNPLPSYLLPSEEEK